MKYTKAYNQIKDLCDFNNIHFNYDFDYNYMNKRNMIVIEHENIIVIEHDKIPIDFKNMILLLKPNEKIIFSVNEDGSIYWDNGWATFIRFNSDAGSFQSPDFSERLHILRFLNNL